MITTDIPDLQEFHLEGVKHISPKNAFDAITKGDAVLIDIREANEVALESVATDNVLFHPMSVIVERLPYIAKDQNIILICNAGIRSTKVANFFNINKFPNVANLDGGLIMWKAYGLPHKSNLRFAGNHCGCGSEHKESTENSCCETGTDGKSTCC